MKTKLLIMLIILAGCNKEIQTEPTPTKQYLSVEVKNGFIDRFEVNGNTVTSPAPVYKGDQVRIKITPLYYGANCWYKVSLDGKILSERTSSAVYETYLQIQ